MIQSDARIRRLVAGLMLVLMILPARLLSARDLLSAFEAAQNSDPTLAGERYSRDASRERVPEARSALLPKLDSTGMVGREGGPVSYSDTPTVDRTFNTLTWSLQFSMPILRPQGIAGYRQSLAEAERADRSFTLAQQDLMIRVSQAYFDILIAEESLSAAEAEERAASEQVALAQASYKRGAGSITDVDEATSREAVASAQQLSALEELEGKRAALASLSGADMGQLDPLRPDAVLLPPEPAELKQWVESARENNQNVMAKRSAVEVARLEVQKARMVRLPSIDAVASYGRDYSSGNNTNPIDYGTNAHIRQGGIQVTLPLIDGGAMHAQVAEAVARQHKAEAELEGARRDAVLQATLAYEGATKGLLRIRALRSAIAASVDSVKGNEAGYKLGIRINSDVLNAQRQRYAAQRDLSKARYETVMQGLRLKAAAGSLGSDDLMAVNRLLSHARE